MTAESRPSPLDPRHFSPPSSHALNPPRPLHRPRLHRLRGPRRTPPDPLPATRPLRRRFFEHPHSHHAAARPRIRRHHSQHRPLRPRWHASHLVPETPRRRATRPRLRPHLPAKIPRHLPLRILSLLPWRQPRMRKKTPRTPAQKKSATEHYWFLPRKLHRRRDTGR